MVLVVGQSDGDHPEGPVQQTRQGNVIRCERRPRLTEAEFYQRRAYQRNKYPLARVRKEPCGLYNCHGMTFLSRRAWLEDEEAIRQVLRDDLYEEVFRDRVLPGDIVLYWAAGEVDHSGIVVRNEQVGGVYFPFVLSKWGHGGEYVHRFDQCPYPLEKVIFYREGSDDGQFIPRAGAG